MRSRAECLNAEMDKYFQQNKPERGNDFGPQPKRSVNYIIWLLDLNYNPKKGAKNFKDSSTKSMLLPRGWA